MYKYFNGNKSGKREGENPFKKENSAGEEKILHISFDDVIEVFYDLTKNLEIYNSIFKNKTLQWLRTLHEKWGGVFTCFCYFEKTGFSLSDCTEKFRDEFEQNSNWLKFAFHTKNEKTVYNNESENPVGDYLKTTEELIRIVGSKSIDYVIRLQSFQGTKNTIMSLNNLPNGPCGFYSADDYRNSYYLNDLDNKYLYWHDYLIDQNGICFISTDIRVEFVKSIRKKLAEFESNIWCNQLDYLIVFTHEWLLNKRRIRKKIEKICMWGIEKHYKFDFPHKYIS